MEYSNQWDINAKLYESYFENDDRVSSKEVFPYILNRLGDLNELKILDLGCGQGRFSRIFSDLKAKVTAYDISPKEIEIALSLNDNRDILYSYNDNIFDSKYDLIFSFMVLLCNPYDEAMKLIKRVFDSLKIGGRCCFVNTNTDELGYRFKDFYSYKLDSYARGVAYDTVIPTPKGDIVVKDYFYSKEHLDEMFLKNAFEIELSEVVSKQFLVHIIKRVS